MDDQKAWRAELSLDAIPNRTRRIQTVPAPLWTRRLATLSDVRRDGRRGARIYKVPKILGGKETPANDSKWRYSGRKHCRRNVEIRGDMEHSVFRNQAHQRKVARNRKDPQGQRG